MKNEQAWEDMGRNKTLYQKNMGVGAPSKVPTRRNRGTSLTGLKRVKKKPSCPRAVLKKMLGNEESRSKKEK